MKSIILPILFLSSFLFIRFEPIYCQVSYSIDVGILEGNNGNIFGDTIFQFPSKGNTFRNGYQVGMRGFFGTYGFFISPSLYYQEFTVENIFSKINPFEKAPRIRTIKPKLTIGYQMDVVPKLLKLNFGGGLNLNYIFSIDENIYRYDIMTLRDIFLAYNFDFGFDLKYFNVNLSYEKSLKEVVIDTNKLDFLILTLGINF